MSTTDPETASPASEQVVPVAPMDMSLSDEVEALAALIGSDSVVDDDPIGRPIHVDLATTPGATKAIPRPLQLDELDGFSELAVTMEEPAGADALAAEVRAPDAAFARPLPDSTAAPVAEPVAEPVENGVDGTLASTLAPPRAPESGADSTVPMPRPPAAQGSTPAPPTTRLAAVSTMHAIASSASDRTLDEAGVLSGDERLWLLESLPVAVFLIDELATIRYANRRTSNMIGVPSTELLGRSVLDFVGVDDLDFAAALVDDGKRFDDRLMGPSRLRYVDAAGDQHWTQVWAQAAPPELGGVGFIVTLTNESVRDVLATAVTGVAIDDNLDRTLNAIAASARALPFEASGAILAIEPAGDDAGHRQFRMIGDWPIDHASINALGTPWRQAIADGAPADIDDVGISTLPPRARDMLLDAGVRGLFVRPVRGRSGEVDAVLVVFRASAGPATVNQEDHLADALSLAGLALAQKRRRRELESAAHLDALSGLPNRASFNERLTTERRATDVLFVDLDHFKIVNDTYGHDVGDRVVRMTAERIEAAIRQVDTAYRTGGDEFIVLCEATGDQSTERIAMAERIIDALRQPYDIAGHRVNIGATIGIAAAGDRSLDDTVQAADRALYRAKELGRAGWSHDGD